MHRSAFAVETQSFLCGKFSTAWLEVLPNLRHAGVFQMSTMVNLGIGFQEPVTCPGVKLDKKMSICSSDSTRSQGVSKFQLAGKWSESEKMSCNAILKKLYEPKTDVILTIGFKITAEIEIRKHTMYVLHPTSQTRRISFVKYMFFYSFIANMKCVNHLHCFYTVNSSVNAARSYWTNLLAEVPWITH